MGRWKCPMCGRMGRQTKEHVWPKWLRQSPMAKNLLANAHGERIPYEYADLCIENGRVVAVPKNVNVAKLVPQITAPVCSKCNNGWMSILEAKVKRVLSPVIMKSSTVHASGLDTRYLAVWAVKTAMTYIIALKKSQGCFTDTEVRRMAAHQEIPTRCKVWLRPVMGLKQFIATRYEGLFMPGGHNMEQPSFRDNLALMLIGMPNLILVVGIAPDQESLWLLEMLLPKEFGTVKAPLIWPDPGGVVLAAGFDDKDDFDPLTIFNGLFLLAENSDGSILDLNPQELSAILEGERLPAALLRVAVDDFVSQCESGSLGESDLIDGVLFKSAGRGLDGEQFDRLFRASLEMVENHAASRPAEVARRCYNLGNLFHFSPGGYSAQFFVSFLMFYCCVSIPGGEYGERKDAFEFAGHSAWRIKAYKAAADMYRAQLSLSAEDAKARFNLAESLFWSGEFAQASDVLEGVNAVDGSLIGDSAACLKVVISVIVDLLGLTRFVGYGGVGARQLFETGFDELGRLDELSNSLRERLLEEVAKVDDIPADMHAIVKAYLLGEIDSWVAAAVTLLRLDKGHPVLKSVIRKGGSLGREFSELFSLQIDSLGCGAELPGGVNAIELALSNSYPKYQSTVRFLGENNEIYRVL